MEQIVHIIPLGYEIDRAVKPFESPNGFKANHIYILTGFKPRYSQDEISEKHRYYFEAVKTRLETLGIQTTLIETSSINFFDVLSKVSYLIKQEQNKGNLVYVNVSASGRLTAISTAIAAMAHGAKTYYIESTAYSNTPEKWLKHGLTIVEEPTTMFLDQFKFQQPNDLQQKTLVQLYKKQQMTTLEIIQYLSDIDSTLFPPNYNQMTRSQKITLNMKVSRRILNHLETAQYIRKEKHGRKNYYLLTESGKNMAALSGQIHP
jgi:DNA-binding PadR family transcriptional regulator